MAVITEIKPEEELSKYTQTLDDDNIQKMSHEYSPRIDGILSSYFPILNNNRGKNFFKKFKISFKKHLNSRLC